MNITNETQQPNPHADLQDAVLAALEQRTLAGEILTEYDRGQLVALERFGDASVAVRAATIREMSDRAERRLAKKSKSDQQAAPREDRRAERETFLEGDL